MPPQTGPCPWVAQFGHYLMLGWHEVCEQAHLRRKGNLPFLFYINYQHYSVSVSYVPEFTCYYLFLHYIHLADVFLFKATYNKRI